MTSAQQRCDFCGKDAAVVKVWVIANGEPRTMALCRQRFSRLVEVIERRRLARLDARLDEALKESFPASDPPAVHG